MARTQNVKRNLTFNIIKYIAQLVLQFVLRTVLMYVMGAEYLGLNGLFADIFQFLNLAELGVGSAIVFAMYKPVAENDIPKIKTLQNLYKKFYLIIALVVLAIGGVLTPFLKILIKDEVTVDINIYILFLMYLFNSIFGYLSAHKRSLLVAYQRNDIESKVKTVCLFAMTLIQIAVLFIFKNYYVYFAVNIVFTIVECVIVQVVANKLYPEINGKSVPLDNETKKSITKNVAALSIHKLGSAVVFSTDSILVSAFFGVVVLGAYSNYALIITSLSTIFNIMETTIAGSVGNLIASTDTNYVHRKYKQINFIYSFVTAFCTICMFVIFQPFITVWTAKAKGGPLLLNFSTMALLCVSFYLTKMRKGTRVFNDCAGIFWQNKWQPIVEALVNIGASIGFIYLLGIDGVFLGTIVSTIIAPLWNEPRMLYKHYFKQSPACYFKRYLLDVIITILVGAVCFFTCMLIPEGGILLLIVRMAVCVILCVGLLVACYCWTPEFKDTINLVKPFFNKIFKGKKKTEAVSENQNENQTEMLEDNAYNEENIVHEDVQTKKNEIE